MTKITVTIIETCKACLESREVDKDGLCESCALWNDSLDGTLLALLNAPGAASE